MITTVSGITIPDTKLANEATALVKQVASGPLFNHCVRSYFFAAALGKRLNKPFDAEILYLASVMHDLGVVEKYIGPARFEIDGADAATAFLRERSYPEDKTSLVWDAIALHSSMEIAERKQTEVALLHLGVFMDAGRNASQLPSDFFDEIFQSFPRDGFSAEFYNSLAEVLRRKPHTAYLSFKADIARRHVQGFNPPNFCDMIPPPPFNQ
jgi:hypothetical protein